MKKLGKDIQILRDGPICLYFKNTILDEDLNWFSNNDFEVIDMNTQSWNRKNAHKYLKTALNFPDYYGENLDAFNDSLGDMYNERFKGLILIFRQYDNFVSEDQEFAEGILDVIARNSREWLLIGQKLITLVQSNNPNLYFPKLGGISPNWNAAEWLNENRKL